MEKNSEETLTKLCYGLPKNGDWLKKQKFALSVYRLKAEIRSI
jgi:hypothetical protein